MSKFVRKILWSLVFLTCFYRCSESSSVKYDIVIKHARVIDPDSGTDEILNVAIMGDKIAAIGKENFQGKKEIDGTGKVLSAGFIDLHAHGQTNKENYYQVYDGVTTALELEVGVDTLNEWFNARKDKAILNFGTSACQLAFRNKVIAKDNRIKETIFDELTDSAAQMVLLPEDYGELRKKIIAALESGAIGIGIPVGYLPTASIEEIEDVYELAGELQVPIFSHVREGGAIAFQQAIADAVLNDAPLHICHINSMARKDIAFCIDEVEKAQKKGFKITTELYPYTAGNTEIGSAIFNDGWKDRLGCSHGDLQWVETGERLTAETFKEKREAGGSVIVHMMKEDWIDLAIKSDVTMIASDGGTYSDYGHPRSAGTFCKVLRKYVRENKVLSLNKAIEKMSLMPAKLLENYVPEMKLRGRVQVGCYADLILFDPEIVEDKATYENGFNESKGMDFVIVNGIILIENGVLRKKIFPGVAIKSKFTKES